jgi:hypothetical protein
LSKAQNGKRTFRHDSPLGRKGKKIIPEALDEKTEAGVMA